jgi:hypothetical protein
VLSILNSVDSGLEMVDAHDFVKWLALASACG